jgi:hypothetical protein
VTQPLDPEIKALRAILRALKPLPRDMRLRVLMREYNASALALRLLAQSLRDR